jgi:hypothetical protein
VPNPGRPRSPVSETSSHSIVRPAFRPIPSRAARHAASVCRARRLR